MKRRQGRVTSIYSLDKFRRSGADFSCPGCDRPTLGQAAGEVVDWKCGVCDTRVTERGEMA